MFSHGSAALRYAGSSHQILNPQLNFVQATESIARCKKSIEPRFRGVICACFPFLWPFLAGGLVPG